MAEKPMQMTSKPAGDSSKSIGSAASEPKSSSLDLNLDKPLDKKKKGARWYWWPIIFLMGAVTGFVLGIVLI